VGEHLRRVRLDRGLPQRQVAEALGVNVGTTLADHLKNARLDRGIPQKDAARAIGCGPLTFLHWEKGRVRPG
jgi:transcriptional regulator with XRE-family HTH domain